MVKEYKVDPELYEGRTFSPVVDKASNVSATYETSKIGPDGMVCIKFTAPATIGKKVSVGGGVKPSTQTPDSAHGIHSMVAFGEHGKFDHNCVQGLNAYSQAVVVSDADYVQITEAYAAGKTEGKAYPSGWRGGIPLKANQTCYANVAKTEPEEEDYLDFRVSLTILP